MKKSDSTSNDKSLKEEIKRLKKENAQLISKSKKSEAIIAKLDSKITKQKSKLKEKNKQLKKKDVPKRTLTKEQQNLISKLFQDIDTLF